MIVNEENFVINICEPNDENVIKVSRISPNRELKKFICIITSMIIIIMMIIVIFIFSEFGIYHIVTFKFISDLCVFIVCLFFLLIICSIVVYIFFDGRN